MKDRLAYMISLTIMMEIDKCCCNGIVETVT